MPRHPDILLRRGTVLAVVDVQERINGAMADQGHLARLAALIRGASTLAVPVLATEQYPRGLGATVPELAALLPEPPLVKETFSCAGDEAFLAAVERLRPQQVVVTGIEAHVCVLQTGLDLLHRGYQVQVPHDAVASRRTADRDWALHRLDRAGAIITTAESALFELLERCATDDFRTVARLVKELPVP